MSSQGRTTLGRVVALLSFAIFGASAQAQQAEPTTPPGFRPPSPHAEAFLESLDSARVVVLPTVVRGMDWIRYSPDSQQRIVDFLDETGLARAAAADRRIDLGVAPHKSQWDLFQGTMGTIAEALAGWRSDADYTLVMEVLLEPGNQVVFGIQTYILDREGRNAFSFLLNSHHEAFAAAHLVTEDETEQAEAAMIADATRLGVVALGAQIEAARECAAWMAANPPQAVPAGVFQDFEAGLPEARDPHGIPLGFSSFTDGESTVEISTTDAHPPREGEAPGNNALRIDLDVTGWAGFGYLVHDASTQSWRPQDWSAFDGLSFWMYGRNSGTRFFVDVMDNRNPCSTWDDAERYVYEFTDDFSGWKQVVVPFRDMVRKEIGNGAPDDGLGLSRVHGWAFGATGTDGPGTWYLDDVVLWTAGAG